MGKWYCEACWKKKHMLLPGYQFPKYDSIVLEKKKCSKCKEVKWCRKA